MPPGASEPAAARRGFRRWRFWLLVLFCLNAVALPVLLRGDSDGGSVLDGVPQELPAFALVMALSVGVALPSSPFCVAAGYLFGFSKGLMAAWIGNGVGALIAFALGRLALGRVQRWLMRRFPRFGALSEAFGAAGVWTVFLARLSPIFPFAVQNFGWAFTRVRFRDYVLGTALGVGPGALLFAHLGAAGRAGVDMARGDTTLSGVITIAGIAATIPLVRWLGRVGERALGEQTGG